MNPEGVRRGLRLPRVQMPLLWASGLAIALAATLVVVWSALKSEPVTGKDWRDADRARRIEAISRELAGLLHELEQAPPASSVAERAKWETHVSRDVRPRISEFRRRLLSERLDGAAYESLLRAADLLGAAVANPGDERALDAARRARDETQARVREELAVPRGS